MTILKTGNLIIINIVIHLQRKLNETAKLEYLKRNRYRVSLFLFSAAGLIALMVLFAKGMKGIEPSFPELIEEKSTPVVDDSTPFELPSSPPFRDFVSYMDQELDSSHTVGAAYTFVRSGKIEYTQTFGE